MGKLLIVDLDSTDKDKYLVNPLPDNFYLKSRHKKGTIDFIKYDLNNLIDSLSDVYKYIKYKKVSNVINPFYISKINLFFNQKNGSIFAVTTGDIKIIPKKNGDIDNIVYASPGDLLSTILGNKGELHIFGYISKKGEFNLIIEVKVCSENCIKNYDPDSFSYDIQLKGSVIYDVI